MADQIVLLALSGASLIQKEVLYRGLIRFLMTYLSCMDYIFLSGQILAVQNQITPVCLLYHSVRSLVESVLWPLLYPSSNYFNGIGQYDLPL